MAAPGAPASDSMRVRKVTTTGGRTRNVINIADPGASGTKAYEFTATTESPTSGSSAVGFANFRRQRYLHVQSNFTNNEHNNDEVHLEVWLYNSFSSVWTKFQRRDGEQAFDDSDLILKLKGNKAKFRYDILDIQGAERVFIQATTFTDGGGSAALKCNVWLGVNSF